MGFPFFIFIRVYQSPFALHRLCRHCSLNKYFIVFTKWNLRLSTTPWKLSKILSEDSRHRDYTYQGSDRKDPIVQLFRFPTQGKKGEIQRIFRLDCHIWQPTNNKLSLDATQTTYWGFCNNEEHKWCNDYTTDPLLMRPGFVSKPDSTLSSPKIIHLFWLPWFCVIFN